MASTYSQNLSLELIGTGDQAGTWGVTTNTNLGTLIEQAISGYVTQAVATGTDTTITIPNGATGVARNMFIEMTGTGGAATNLIVPANKKLYFIYNNSTGAVTVKVSGQTGVSVPQGKKMILVSNGTDVVAADNYIADFGSNSATITQLTSTSGTITTLGSTSAAITTLSGTTLTYTSASVTNLTAGSLVLSNLSISSANITTLTSSSATISTTLALSGGTANGVLYLNGSKVATSGSALVFDGSNLGLGVTPSAWGLSGLSALQIKNASFFGYVNNAYMSANEYNDSAGTPRYIASAAATRYVQSAGTHAWNTAASGTAGNAITFTQAMTLDASGNLGIGTSSPGSRLEIAAANPFFTIYNTSTSDNGITWESDAASGASRASLFLNYTNAELRMTAGVSGNSYIQTFYTNGTEKLRLDASGNLGLGVTPSAWKSTNPAFQIGQSGSVFSYSSTNIVGLGANFFINSAGDEKYITTNTAGFYRIFGNVHTWWNAPSGTAGNTITFTQAMTLDASGNLQLGGTTNKTTGVSGSGSGFTVQASGAPTVSIWDTTDTSYYTNFTQINEVSYLWNIANGAMIFATNNTERARITAGGYFKASPSGTYQSSTGAYHELRAANSGDWVTYIQNTGSSAPYGLYLNYTAASPNGTASQFILCADSTATRAEIRSNGGLANYQANNVDLSDARTKKEINPASSMWDKIGALEIVTYKYNDQTHDDVNVGVIAQQVEAVDPVWVDSDGFGETPEGEEPLKTVYTKDIYFAAIKALQEAMARIEKLEAEVAALKGA